METITRYNANGMPYKTEMSKEEAMLLVHTMAHSFLLRASNPLLYPVNTKDRGETAWLVVERLLKTQEEDPAAELDRLKAQNAELVRVLWDVLHYCVPPKGLPDAVHRTIEQKRAYENARAALDKAGIDSGERWGNCAIPGVGTNSPAMMDARAGFLRDKA